MVQFLNEFMEHCKRIGLLATDQQFKQVKQTLEETLFMHLLTMDRLQLIELSNRVTSIWLDKQCSRSPSCSNYEIRGMSVSEANTKSSSNFNHLYDQYMIKEENNIIKQQQLNDDRMKECTFKPKITKKSQQMEINSPAHIRLNKYASDKKIKQQISSEMQQQKALKDCTFKPSINNKKESSFHNQSVDNPFDRLYQHALTQRYHNHKHPDESQYTYSPQLISSPPPKMYEQPQLPVEERLYNHHFDKINSIINKQQALEEETMLECTFTPQINQINQKTDQKVFDRLYNHSNQKLSQECKDSSLQKSFINKKSESIIRNPISDSNSYVTSFQVESNPHDRMYFEHIRQEKKKKLMQIQHFQSMPFKPIINKPLQQSNQQ